MLRKIELAAQIATAVSAVVAVVTLAITLLVIRSETRTRRIEDWQKVVVYSILSKADLGGLSFEEIKRQYLNEVQTFGGFDIPKEAIQDSALNRVLMTLYATGVIERDKERQFTLRLVSPLRYRASIDEERERGRRMQAADDNILSRVRIDNCRYTPNQIAEIVVPQYSLQPGEFNVVISTMISQNRVKLDDKNRLCSVAELIRQ